MTPSCRTGCNNSRKREGHSTALVGAHIRPLHESSANHRPRRIGVIRVIEDQITTLRPYNARYTGDHRSIFRKRYRKMITRVSLVMQLLGPDKPSPFITERNRARSSRRSEGSRSSALHRSGPDRRRRAAATHRINRCRRLPVWLPHGEPACGPYPVPRFTLVSAHPPGSISDGSDCLRAVPRQRTMISNI
jgi:hypothetical protein